MKFDANDIMKTIAESLGTLDYIHSDDIPGIELYMDQVTTFMDDQLKSTKRHGEDKILTKTMINNYVKNNLLPPPVKKKYSKNHVLILIFIYYFKNILSIKDIESILSPIINDSFDSSDSDELNKLYKKICALEKCQMEPFKEELKMHYKKAEELFPDSEYDDEYTRLFAFICSLSFDVYMKKLIIEKLVDSFYTDDPKDE